MVPSIQEPSGPPLLYTDKYFLNLVNTNQIQIVITIFRQVQHHLEFRLVLNLLDNGNYIPNLVWANNISKRFLRVYAKAVESCKEQDLIQILLYRVHKGRFSALVVMVCFKYIGGSSFLISQDYRKNEEIKISCMRIW